MRAGILKVVLAMAGIFTAGAVVGGVGTYAWTRKPSTRISSQEFVDRQLRKRVEQLDLSAAQVERIRPIMRRFEESMRACRKRAFAEMGQQVRDLNAGIEEELTPEQRVRFREIQEKERERYDRAIQGPARPPHSHKDDKPPAAPARP